MTGLITRILVSSVDGVHGRFLEKSSARFAAFGRCKEMFLAFIDGVFIP